VARQAAGARGVSDLTEEQRDEYENLVLLCTAHHKQVDDQPAHYTVAELKAIKLHHERWVRTSLNLLNSKDTSSDSLSRDDGPLIISPVSHSPAHGGGFVRARRESDGSIVEAVAAHSGHVIKNGKFYGAGLEFTMTNSTELSMRINRIIVNVCSAEKLVDASAVSGGAGGGANRNLYWCELLPDPGIFECRYLSDTYDYVKILGHDLECFEVYLVERTFENRLYTLQLHVDFILGANEQGVTLEPVSLAFIEDWDS
jgi:hypothetical protein